MSNSSSNTLVATPLDDVYEFVVPASPTQAVTPRSQQPVIVYNTDPKGGRTKQSKNKKTTETRTANASETKKRPGPTPGQALKKQKRDVEQQENIYSRPYNTTGRQRMTRSDVKDRNNHPPPYIADLRAQLTHLEARTKTMQEKTEILTMMADLTSKLESLNSELDGANRRRGQLLKGDKYIFSVLKDDKAELSDEEHLRIADALAAGTSDDQPLAQTEHQEITGHDFSTLAPSEGHLNDVIINGYFDLLFTQHPDKGFALDSHFYNSVQARSDKLDNWLKNHRGENQIYIPVNDKHHWFLIVVSVSRATIECYDSLADVGISQEATRRIKEFFTNTKLGLNGKM
ncbi:MAG: Sentrin-specific protease 2 [Peltula sp. TS41687]|nr:MAG: Sentrin-specific protease 2 [Peltula sp. TS41687]